jgi:hypothetical protein
VKEAPFLKPASQGHFVTTIPCSSVSHFMSCWWVWVAKRCSITSRRGLQWIGEVIGVGEVGAGQERDARRRTVKSATSRPAIQKLATVRFVGAIYLWFVIGDSSTHLRSTRVRRSEIRKMALADTVLICRHRGPPTDADSSIFDRRLVFAIAHWM